MTDRSVVYRLRADVTQFRAQMATAAASVKTTAETMTASNKKSMQYREGLTTVGHAAGLVGLAAGAGLALVVRSAANFDQAMSSVQAATHETSANMDLLRTAAINAGQATKYSATEAAGGIEALAKAGVSTTDILNGGLKGALSLAAAGNQSVADAAETAASAMTQFGLSGKDIPHIADLLAAGAGKAQGEVSDLAMALNQTGLVASQTGLSINETTAGLAAFASAGLIGSDAGTSFKTMLLRLTPTSGKAAALMQSLGLSAYNSQGQFIGLAKFAGVLQDKLGGMSAEQRNATLQTIFGQDAVRAANVLYNQGADGITNWTKKVNVQGYAAQTAAIKMDNLAGDLEQLRGSLETAFIGAGEGSQGPLRSLVQTLTKVVNATNSIPGPAKQAGTALLAIAALGGGGLFAFSKVVTGIASMKVALKQLGFEAETTRQKMALIGVSSASAALGVGAFVNAIDLMDTHSRSSDAADATVKSFQDLSDALQYSNLGKNAADLHIDLGRLSEDLYNNGAQGKYVTQVLEQLKGTSHGMGALLNAELGHITLGQFGGSADKASDSLKDLNAIMANGAGAFGKGAQATTTLTHAMKQNAQVAHQMSAAEKAARQAATQTAESFVGLGKSLNDNKVSLQGWIKQLRDEAQALKNFRVNAETAAKKGLDDGLTAALEKAGPAGALRMKQLANASQTEIASANRAWESGQRQIKLFADAVTGVPKFHSTKLTVDTSDALSRVVILRREIDLLHGKTIVIRTTGGHVTGGADGGMVAGAPRNPYGDKVLIAAAPGEEIISNRHGQADRFRADRRAGRIPGYAGGGTVSGSDFGGVGITPGHPIVNQIHADQQRIKDLQKSIDRLTNTVDDEKRSRDNLAAKEQALASTVTNSLRSDLFGVSGSPSGVWASGASQFEDPNKILRGDIRHARAYNQALHTLRRKGLTGGAFAALAASGDLQAVQAEAGMSRAEIAQYAHLYKTRQHLTAVTGQYAGDVRFGSQLDKANAILDHSRNHLQHMNQQMKQLNHEVAQLRKEAKHNAEVAASGKDKAAATAKRRATR